MGSTKKSKKQGSSVTKNLTKGDTAEKQRLIEELRHFELQYKDEFPRPFYLSTLKNVPFTINTKDLINLGILLLLSLFARMYKLDFPPKMTFKEKSSVIGIVNYLQNQFYIDLYPPLVKMVFAFVVSIFGFDGNLSEFENSPEFPPDFPFLLLRFVTCLQGIFTVFMTYFTLKMAGCALYTSLAASILLLLDPANIVISKVFVIEPFLISSICFVTLCYVKLGQLSIFSRSWFKLFYLLGLGLGITCSIKYTGFLTLGWILALQLKKTWLVMGDLTLKSQQPRFLIKYLFAQFFFVIIVPLAIFFSINILSLRLLSKVNSVHDDQGYSLMSTTFQGNLLGNDLGVAKDKEFSDIPLNILYGSRVTIRHLESLGGYLHSHEKNYSSGSHGQQVTLYNFRDENNEWIIEYKSKKLNADLYSKKKFVSEGQIIRLKHATTGKYLHVSDIRGPVSEQEYHYEVSAKGGEDYQSDSEDTWSISYEINHSDYRIDNAPGDSIIHPIGSVFKLWNRAHKCHLLSHDITLPDWGSNQQEVVCVKEASKTKSLFYVEKNSHPLLDNNMEQPRVKIHKLNMLEKFIEYCESVVKYAKNRNMFIGDVPTMTSPEEWLVSDNSLLFFQKPHSINLRFFTSLIVQYAGLAIIAIFIVLNVALLIINLKWYGNMLLSSAQLKSERDSSKLTLQEVKEKLATLRFNHYVLDFILGWVFHYAPFLLLGNTYMSHNYLSAYFFLFLILGQTFQLLLQKSKVSYGIVSIFALYVISSSMRYRAEIYGIPH